MVQHVHIIVLPANGKEHHDRDIIADRRKDVGINRFKLRDGNLPPVQGDTQGLPLLDGVATRNESIHKLDVSN